MTPKQKAEREARARKVFTFDGKLARQAPQAFKVGSPVWKLITSPTSSFEDFVGSRENWFAQEYRGSRHEYSPEHMSDLWQMILCQKEKNELLFSEKNQRVTQNGFTE